MAKPPSTKSSAKPSWKTSTKEPGRNQDGPTNLFGRATLSCRFRRRAIGANSPPANHYGAAQLGAQQVGALQDGAQQVGSQTGAAQLHPQPQLRRRWQQLQHFLRKARHPQPRLQLQPQLGAQHSPQGALQHGSAGAEQLGAQGAAQVGAQGAAQLGAAQLVQAGLQPHIRPNNPAFA